MLGGVTVNLLLAIGIYILILFVWGEEYLPASEVKYGIMASPVGNQMGLRDGDKIVSIDHKTVDAFDAIPGTILFEDAKSIQVIRGGMQQNVIIPSGFQSKLIKLNQDELAEFITYRIPFVVVDFSSDSPAKKAGILANDRIIGINNTLIPYINPNRDPFTKIIQQYNNQKVKIIVLRGSDTIKMDITVTKDGKIGVFGKPPTSFFRYKVISYNFISAIPSGVSKTFAMAGKYLKGIKKLFTTEKAYESVGGFITIGNIFPSTWNWEIFLSWTAFLSIMLAILNVLPIPALDGGHVLFLLYEITFRRKPSDKFMEYAQYTGMILLFGLLIFANMNDIYKLFRH
jgi:regulator of sigma E protease